MARAADTGGGSAYVKFVDLGDTFVGAYAGKPKECKRQARNFDTGEPAVKPDGSPLMEEVLWFVAMPGTTAKLGNADKGYSSIEPGAEVFFAVQKRKWGQVIDARHTLPAFSSFGEGQTCSSDVYTITLSGWSAETKNPQAAEKAGFTVVDGRIVLHSQEEKDAYVLSQSRAGGNTNPAKDFTVSIRRIGPDEKRWEQAADDLFDRQPWKGNTAQAAAADTADGGYEEPF